MSTVDKITMEDWATREVKIACERAKAIDPNYENSADFECECYNNALKAYKCLLDGEPSGDEFELTKDILIRLMKHKPLTPIAGNFNEWETHVFYDFGYTESCEQNVRLNSLSKIVYIFPSHKVEYYDSERVLAWDPNTGTYWQSYLADKVVDELDPITMPYYPFTEPILVQMDRYSVDYENDTVFVSDILYPDHTKKSVDKYFIKIRNGWIEISYDEFYQRLQQSKKEE